MITHRSDLYRSPPIFRENITFIASSPFVTAALLKRQAAIRLLDFTIHESLMLERNLRATYAGTEVIRAKHHAVMVETSPGSKSTDFLTHRLEKNIYIQAE